MNQQPQTRRDIEARIIAKAWKDDAFKQELLTNSKAVIEREFGVQLPEEINVQIKEENPTSLYFVLPMCPQIEGQEISEEELDAVAGGGTPGIIFGSLMVTPMVPDVVNATKKVTK